MLNFIIIKKLENSIIIIPLNAHSNEINMYISQKNKTFIFMKNNMLFWFMVFIFSLTGIVNVFSQTNWTSFYAYHARNINDVFVNDYNHICLVGGNKRNDSIQSIFTSSDAGSTWNSVSDNMGSWLKSVYFTTSLQGFAVGDYGKILKTTDGGNTWTKITLTGNLNQRNFCSVFFTDTQNGYIVGGNENTGMQTILKTTDGGITWNIIKDISGEFLNAVYFPSLNIGFSVGNHGTFYKTTDAGNTWIAITIPGNVGTRNYKSTYFISNTLGFIVGGNLTNDSIQTILKTTDGGNNWTAVSDILAPMLNDVYFVNQNNGYTVGNNGVVLYTSNTGNTWQTVNLPNNNNYTFNAVYFYNSDYGYIVGNQGIVYRYYNPLGQSPNAQTMTAKDLNADTITLHAIVNPNGYDTHITFEYGVTGNYGNTLDPNPNSIQGNNNIDISTKLYPLSANTLYHYRIKAWNSMGTAYGDDKQFYTGTPIPNFSFENWDTLSYNFPTFYDYISSTATRTNDAYHGVYAIQLKNDSVHSEPGVILMGKSKDGMIFTGGVPFSARPDSLKLFAKYSIHANDSATILLLFKHTGTVISKNIYKITGNSNNQFQEITFPVEYFSPEVPDSLIFCVLSANIDNIPNLYFDNSIVIDNIQFAGTLDSLPNFDFEFWNNIQYPVLQSWNYHDKDLHELSGNFAQTATVLPSQIYHHGNRSVLLKNILLSDDSFTARITTNKFPIYYKPVSLTGYYFYNNDYQVDTFNVSINLYRNDTIIANGIFKTTTKTSSFEPFEIPLFYLYNEFPDSAEIVASTFINVPQSESVVLLDDLNFDSFLIHVSENNQNTINKLLINVSPNPVNSLLSLDIKSPQETKACIYLIDNQGKILVMNTEMSLLKGENKFIYNVSAFSKGLYNFVVITSNSFCTQKVIVY
jgi:photosystem II stability/assembly factor-like uncharacterized protein